MKIVNKGQAQLFKIKQLERLTKSNPLVIISIYILVISLLITYSYNTINLSGIMITLLFLSGMFIWTIFEYILHRYVFHLHPKGALGKRIIYIIHGNHHKYPRDRQRLLMPIVPSMLISSLLLVILYSIAELFGIVYTVAPFFAGFLFGYLIYGCIHYAIHAWAPPFKWMKPLWRNHHLHHYKEEEKGFGVSSTLWDQIFGSMSNLKKEKEDKQKTNELMFIK